MGCAWEVQGSVPKSWGKGRYCGALSLMGTEWPGPSRRFGIVDWPSCSLAGVLPAGTSVPYRGWGRGRSEAAILRRESRKPPSFLGGAPAVSGQAAPGVSRAQETRPCPPVTRTVPPVPVTLEAATKRRDPRQARATETMAISTGCTDSGWLGSSGGSRDRRPRGSSNGRSAPRGLGASSRLISSDLRRRAIGMSPRRVACSARSRGWSRMMSLLRQDAGKGSQLGSYGCLAFDRQGPAEPCSMAPRKRRTFLLSPARSVGLSGEVVQERDGKWRRNPLQSTRPERLGIAGAGAEFSRLKFRYLAGWRALCVDSRPSG